LRLLDVLGVKEVSVRVEEFVCHSVGILGKVLLHVNLVEQ
jgi:hypothetical protein